MENSIRKDYSPGGTPGASNANRKRVVAPIERDGKTYWLRVGAAFQNRDQSWNLYIDAFPISGRLQLRDWDESWESRGGARGGAVPSISSLSLPAMNGGGAPENDNNPGDPF